MQVPSGQALVDTECRQMQLRIGAPPQQYISKEILDPP